MLRREAGDGAYLNIEVGRLCVGWECPMRRGSLEDADPVTTRASSDSSLLDLMGHVHSVAEIGPASSRAAAQGKESVKTCKDWSLACVSGMRRKKKKQKGTRAGWTASYRRNGTGSEGGEKTSSDKKGSFKCKRSCSLRHGWSTLLHIWYRDNAEGLQGERLSDLTGYLNKRLSVYRLDYYWTRP